MYISNNSKLYFINNINSQVEIYDVVEKEKCRFFLKLKTNVWIDFYTNSYSHYNVNILFHLRQQLINKHKNDYNNSISNYIYKIIVIKKHLDKIHYNHDIICVIVQILCKLLPQKHYLATL